MVPPVPIPNTVVKHLEAESTCMETCWEDRKLPVKKKALNISVLFLSSKKISLALNYKGSLSNVGVKDRQIFVYPFSLF